MRIEFNLPDSLMKDSEGLRERVDKINEMKVRLMAIEQLGWCKDAKFSKAPEYGSYNQIAPEWLLKTGATGPTSKPEPSNPD